MGFVLVGEGGEFFEDGGCGVGVVVCLVCWVN